MYANKARLMALNSFKSRYNVTSSVPKPKEVLKSLFGGQSPLIGGYLSRLHGCNHPILAFTRGFDLEGNTPSGNTSIFSYSFQLRSLVVLLVSKTIGISPQLSVNEVSTVEDKQKSLSEITELIYAAHMLHRTVVETPDLKYVLTKTTRNESSDSDDPNLSSVHLGNKLAILMGDMLLAKSSKRLALLRNNQVTELMSDSIADFTESDFLNYSSLNNNENCSSNNFSVNKPSYEKWLQRTQLSIGSLLGHACDGAAVFGKQDEITRRAVFTLGKKIGLLLQAYKDLSMFQNEDEEVKYWHKHMVAWSLPVIFHQEEKASSLSIEPECFQQVYDSIKSNTAALLRTKETILELRNDAAKVVSQLDVPSQSKKVLHDFLHAVSS